MRIIGRLSSPREGKGGDATFLKFSPRNNGKASDKPPRSRSRNKYDIEYDEDDDEYDAFDEEDELQKGVVTGPTNSSSVDEEEEQEEGEVHEYSEDEDDSDDSDAEDSTLADDANEKKPFSFRRVFTPKKLKNMLMKKKKNQELSDDEDDGSSDSSSSACSSEEDSDDEEVEGSSEDEDDEEQDPVEALGHDLEAMGYDLECDSFLTKGSSQDSAAVRERYAPSKKNSRKARNTKKKQKSANTGKMEPVDEDWAAEEEESCDDDEEEEERDDLNRRPGKGWKLMKGKRNRIREADSDEEYDSGEDGDDDGEERDDASEGDSSAESSSSEHSGDIVPKVMSADTNTSSKIRGFKKYYTRNIDEESIGSLKELMKKKKSKEKTMSVIPPPAMVKRLRKKNNKEDKTGSKKKHSKPEKAQKKRLVSSEAKYDAKVVDTQLSRDDQEVESSTYVGSVQGGKDEVNLSMNSLRGSTKDYTHSLSNRSGIEIQAPVIIEGMSVVRGDSGRGKRVVPNERKTNRKGDPNSTIPTEIEAVRTNQRERTTDTLDTAGRTLSTNHMSSNHGTRNQPLQPVQVFPMNDGEAKKAPKRFHLPNIFKRQKTNIAQAPSAMPLQPGRANNHAENLNSPGKLLRVLGRDTPTQRHGDPHSLPMNDRRTDFNPQTNTNSSIRTGSYTAKDRFFEMVKSKENEEEETMAPGQIEVTFNSCIGSNNQMVPVPRIDPKSKKSSSQIDPPQPPQTSPTTPTAAAPIQRFNHEHHKTSTNVDIAAVPQIQPTDSKKKRPFLSFLKRDTPRGVNHVDPNVPKTTATNDKTARVDQILKESETSTVNESSYSFGEYGDSRLSTYPSESCLRFEDQRPEQPNATKNKDKKPGIPLKRSSGRDRAHSSSRSDKKDDQENFATTVNDLVNGFFHPSFHANQNNVGPKSPRPTGLLQDWFNLDMLGTLDWAKSHEHRDRMKGKSTDISEVVSADTSFTDPKQDHQPIRQTDDTWQSESIQLVDVSPSPVKISKMPPKSAPVTQEQNNRTVQVTESPQQPPTQRGRPGLMGLFRGRSAKKQKNAQATSGKPAGTSAGEPSTFYPVEYNDDNNVDKSTRRPAAIPCNNNRRRMESHKMPRMKDCGSRSDGNVSKAPSSLVALPSDRQQSLLSGGSTLASLAQNHNAPRKRSGVVIKRSSSDLNDTWQEIADASLVVEKAMDRLDTFKSEDTEDPAKLKFLLSVVSDDDTIGDVEKALAILRKHAGRLGVKETDLLMAVGSQDTTGNDTGAEDSYKSLTFGEELYNTFTNMLVAKNSRRKR